MSMWYYFPIPLYYTVFSCSCLCDIISPYHCTTLCFHADVYGILFPHTIVLHCVFMLMSMGYYFPIPLYYTVFSCWCLWDIISPYHCTTLCFHVSTLVSILVGWQKLRCSLIFAFMVSDSLRYANSDNVRLDRQNSSYSIAYSINISNIINYI
jgi:hypothetical protein